MKQIIYVLIVCALIVSSCNTKKQNSNDIFTKLYNTNNLPKQSFTIDASKDTILKGKQGTRLSITKNSFVNKQGQVISGEVHIELQEVITAKDMVLGNLTTTTNGEMLQSGGMIYVNATSNKEQLEIAKSSPIGISVPSANKLPGMQIFSAEVNPETNQINWVKPEDIIQQKDTQISNSKALLRPTYLKDSKKANKTAPVKPIKANDSDNRIIHFTFENPESFPELQQYQNVKFRVSEKSEYSPQDAKHNWMRVELEKTNTEGVYIVTFSGYENNVYIEKKYEVTPALEGEDYAKAIALYNKKYEQYKSKQKEITEEKKEQEIELAKEQARLDEEQRQREIELAKQEARNEKIRKQREIEFAIEQKKRQKEQEERIKNDVGVNRFATDPSTNYIYEIKKLGWSNIDRLYSDPRTKPVELITSIQNHSDFTFVYITMIIRNLNMYIPGYKKRDKTFGFSHDDNEKMQLPIGESAIILATAYKDGKPYFAIQKLTINSNQQLSFTLQETTSEKIKQILNEQI